MRSPVRVWNGPVWGYSSVGRAVLLHSKGQRFESAYLQKTINNFVLFLKKLFLKKVAKQIKNRI